ncbi:hypothetical protein D3C77_344280 [compost metagenome]
MILPGDYQSVFIQIRCVKGKIANCCLGAGVGCTNHHTMDLVIADYVLMFVDQYLLQFFQRILQCWCFPSAVTRFRISRQ